MDNEKIFLILASQDFQSANHRNLWVEISNLAGCKVYVANIAADYLTSVITKKFYRLKEAKGNPACINNHLSVFRPLLFVRPEVLPDWLFPMVCRDFWKSMKRVDPDIMNKQINLIVYNAFWVKILKGSHPNMKIAYYLFDEVRNNGKDNKVDKRRYRHDEYACMHSDVIFTMTKMLADSRAEYNDNIHVMGNGSVLPLESDIPSYKFQRSVAFIGNFRNWIDEELLEGVIKSKPDVLFAFVGSVESNMQSFLTKLLNNYSNTVFFGKVSKNRMTQIYRMFNVVLIPYKSNPFVQATRPIKIVESVLAGTPVVTIPMNGYEECDFIRFAANQSEFIKQIDYLLENPINPNSSDYIVFCKNNTWKTIAQKIIRTFDDK